MYQVIDVYHPGKPTVSKNELRDQLAASFRVCIAMYDVEADLLAFSTGALTRYIHITFALVVRRMLPPSFCSVSALLSVEVNPQALP